ncbi:MAG TPA: GNAT family N-acetyltransferase [Candidatus Poseidoniales archaeon]|nr:MAG TPA: GNAT family N-acetyltransferase [Candidatus Poseidoniales archaeon]HII57362.1 GNAT family N-acetyltransferase [Candidatus Poseidoniaceae archaeon]|tara:strand:- start:3799 stop:4278 length:480 start_codon:yes stop_codon:yes gene_type:complete
MDDVEWLLSTLSAELEVRPPTSRRREARYLAGNCVKLYHGERLIAYAEMRMVGRHMEISTVLVDAKYRGQGKGKELIKKALKSITCDKILCCTKNPAMAKVLHDLGFTVKKWPGFYTYTILSINTLRRLFSMLLRFEFKRIWQQGKGIHTYDMFVIEEK